MGNSQGSTLWLNSTVLSAGGHFRQALDVTLLPYAYPDMLLWTAVLVPLPAHLPSIPCSYRWPTAFQQSTGPLKPPATIG